MAGKKRSAAERQAYHFGMSRKNSTDKFGNELSDFQRGVHLGKAQMIQKQRMNSAKFYKREKAREYKDLFR